MADDIHNLVLGPFRDIVSKGNQAIENATQGDSSEPIVKAATSLVNNAERALKKIEPVCQRQFNEYHSVFIDALKENDDISHFRGQLNDMIWDLDDSLEVESFDAEIYTKLQTLLKTAALKISDIVVRMKLEHPPPQFQTPMTPVSERPRTPSIVVSPSSGSPMEAKAGPIQGWDEGEEVAAAASAAQNQEQTELPESPSIKTPTIHLEPVPLEPQEDPWRAAASESLTLQIHSLSTEDAAVAAAIQRRPRISPGSQHDGEPVSPLTPDNEAATPPFKHHTPSSSRDHIVSPLDEDSRNSFLLPSENMTRLFLNREAAAQPFSQTSSSSSSSNGPYHQGTIASTTSIHSEYDDDGGPSNVTSGKVVVVPDTEGLIPVEAEYDADIHPLLRQDRQQNPTVIVIDSFPRSQSGIERSPPPPPPPPSSSSSSSSSPLPLSPASRISNHQENNESDLPLLQLTTPGTKITNVSFPAQYNGEWAIGCDPTTHKKGLFPMDCVRIEMPTSGEDAQFFKGMGGDKSSSGGGGGGFDFGIGIGIGKKRGRSASTSGILGGGNGNNGLSGLSAVARWSFRGGSSFTNYQATGTLKKDKGEQQQKIGFSFGGGSGNGGSGGNSEGLQWLKFEKGEVITGICFPHPQHWCWAGYNSKNKWGIFPRAFMTPGTLIEEAPSNLLQLLHKEGSNRPHRRAHERQNSASGGWSPLAPSSPSSSSGGITTGGGNGGNASTTLFSRISAKGLPRPLGLRRLSSGGNSPTITTKTKTTSDGSGTGKRKDSFNSNSNNDERIGRPSEGDSAPDSPSGSFYTPGSAGSSSATRSPRPSLY